MRACVCVCVCGGVKPPSGENWGNAVSKQQGENIATSVLHHALSHNVPRQLMFIMFDMSPVGLVNMKIVMLMKLINIFRRPKVAPAEGNFPRI